MQTRFRHSDFPILPLTTFSKGSSASDVAIAVLPATNVGDWTHVNIHSRPVLTSTALGTDVRSAITFLATFYTLGGSTDPSSNQSVFEVVGGRTLCVGASDQRFFTLESSLDVRLPVIGPWFDLYVIYPATQTNVRGFEVAVWGSNDPSERSASPWPAGNLFNVSDWSGDSIMGDANASFSDTGRGVLVPALTARNVELTNQMIGKGWFSYHIQDSGGAVVDPTKCGSSVITKEYNDISGSTIDQLIYNFPQGIDGASGGIPLTGFRQAVNMVNLSALNLLWHWTVYPEFD